MLHYPEPTTNEGRIVEIYNAIIAIRDDIATIQKSLDAIPIRCQAENIRLGALEQWQWRWTGGLSLLTFVIGIIGAIVVNHLFNLVP